METAFQNDAFQNDAFQIEPVTITVERGRTYRFTYEQWYGKPRPRGMREMDWGIDDE